MPRDRKGVGGIPRGKSHRDSRGGGGGGGGGRGVSSFDNSFMPFAGTQGERKGFSLQEEARNTERHAFWDSDQKLRHTKVNFVSASTTLDNPNTSESNLSPDRALAGMTLESPPNERLEIEVIVEDDNMKDRVPLSKTPSPSPKELSPEPLQYIIDTRGGHQVHTGLPAPRLRSISPTPSNSSEEVILFSGRNNRGKPKIVTLPRTLTDPIDTRIKIIEEKIYERKQLLQDGLNREVKLTPPELSPTDSDAILPRRQKDHQPQRSSRKSFKQEEEEALIADYIRNIDDGDDDIIGNIAFSQRELGAVETSAWQDETTTPSGEDPEPFVHSGWDPSNMCDFDDMSTSDGVLGEVEAIFSKRSRKNGLQYLVVWQDQSVDEARWVPASNLNSISALSCIDDFEAEEKLAADFQDNDDGDSTESEDISVSEDEEDEQDLIQRRQDRMTDEQIARLLAKQEELGIDSSELSLFDGTGSGDEDDNFAMEKTSKPLLALPSRKNNRGSRSPRAKVPAAATLADAYDGFDVMDFERPSLKKKPKGRRGKVVIDLSDSELEASMQMAWDNDRIKKKERKQEREEMRSQGLLGGRKGKLDLKQKYKEGMGFQSIKEEIKIFLMGNNTTLSLPPMDKADRKIVHEIANAFNLKSKSAGKGNTRFPILYRTTRTSAYVEGTFAAVEARINRRFLPRMDVGGKRSTVNRPSRAGGGGGFNSAAVSYRDGDIVGGSAPELGVENRGRAMLEKMGWSTGTALGALNNKGILQPVSHVVKTTKAGLG